MFRGDLIIDGYNVLYAADLGGSEPQPRGLERQRTLLLQLIAGRLELRERRRTTVVFDAPESVMGPSPPQQVADMRILFADRDGDADATIERLIRQNTAPRRLCVVSSDRRLQKAARRRRARFLDSGVFLNQLARRRSCEARFDRPLEPHVKRTGLLSAGEVEAWLLEFEGVDGELAPPPGRRTAPVPDAFEADSPVSDIAGSRPTSSPAPPLRRSAEDAASAAEIGFDEAAFWEARIAELADEADEVDKSLRERH